MYSIASLQSFMHCSTCSNTTLFLWTNIMPCAFMFLRPFGSYYSMTFVLRWRKQSWWRHYSGRRVAVSNKTCNSLWWCIIIPVLIYYGNTVDSMTSDDMYNSSSIVYHLRVRVRAKRIVQSELEGTVQMPIDVAEASIPVLTVAAG